MLYKHWCEVWQKCPSANFKLTVWKSCVCHVYVKKGGFFVLKYCKGVVIAVRRSFDVQMCEGELHLVALRYIEVPLPLQVGRVRLWILGRLDLPIHYRFGVRQGPAFTHWHIQKPRKDAWTERVRSVYQLMVIWAAGPKLIQTKKNKHSDTINTTVTAT